MRAYAVHEALIFRSSYIEAMDMKAGGTELAKDWESDPTVRRRAAVYSMVL